MNSLLFVLNKLKKDQIKLDANFYVFTGSSVGVVPILGKGIYKGIIDKIGLVTSRIN
jgi:2-keto-4-pentenoate hydratase